MDFTQLTIKEIQEGYRTVNNGTAYECLICGEIFDHDEVFNIEGRYFTSERMIKHHIATQHGHPLNHLLTLDKKLTTLTDNQRDILSRIASGEDDQTIAKALGLSSSTIRHFRFTMKEKSRQAKVFLAIYDAVFTSPTDFVPIHSTATMVDERYLTTEAEKAKILENMFFSLSPLKLKTFSSKEKKKIIILKQIAESFDPTRQYTELELNAVLKEIYADFATIRRYLIEYGFMERSKDGKTYKLKSH